MEFFKVKSLYFVFEFGSEFLFQRTLFGIHGCHLNWAFFSWEASWNKVLTIYQLQRREWPLENSFFCFFFPVKSKGNLLIIFSSLYQIKGSTAVAILFLWLSLGGPFHGKSNSFKLAWVLCRKEREKSMESRSSLHFFRQFGRNKMEEFLKMRSSLINSWNIRS